MKHDVTDYGWPYKSFPCHLTVERSIGRKTLKQGTQIGLLQAGHCVSLHTLHFHSIGVYNMDVSTNSVQWQWQWQCLQYFKCLSYNRNRNSAIKSSEGAYAEVFSSFVSQIWTEATKKSMLEEDPQQKLSLISIIPVWKTNRLPLHHMTR